MTTFFEHQRTSFKKKYLKTLIHLASSDEHLDGAEKELITSIGLKQGLKSWQIEELLNDKSDVEAFIPESIGNRLALVYDVMWLIHADGVVSEKEMEFFTNIIQSFAFEPQIEKEIYEIFEAGKPTLEEWKSFVDYVLIEALENH